METTKYIIKQHSDVNKLLNLIYKAKIISFEQAVFFLQQLGLKQKRVDDILNIIRFSGDAFFSPDERFIAANKMIFQDNYIKHFSKVDKYLWVYLYLMKTYTNVNFDCKYPCGAFIFSDNGENFANVFRISHGKIYDDCNNIDTNFSTHSSKKKPINAIIVIDNLDDANDVIFENTINVLAFVTVKREEVTQAMIVKFFDKELKEIEVN